MATYSYVKTDGTTGTTTDQSNAPGIDPHSGFQVINSSSLAPTGNIQVPAYTPPTTPSVDTLAAQYMTPSADQTAAQNEQTDLLTRIKSLYDTSGTKSAVQGQLETQAGIPDLQKQLNEINAQIGSYTAQAKQFQTNQEDRQTSMFAITGSQAAAERQLSAKTFGLAAAAQALQGNIALAKDNVQRALSAQFDPLESQIKYQETLLNLNRENMSKADQKKADLFNLQLQQRKEDLAAKKDEQSKIYDLVIKAGANRASNAVLQQIQNSPDYATALKVASAAGVLDMPYKPTSGGVGTPKTGIAKGKLSDNGFVNKVLSSMGVAYQDAVDKVSPGMIGVIDNRTGAVGEIPPGEFDSAKYTKL